MTRDRLWHWQHRYAPYLFLLPFGLLFAVFLAYPLARSFWLSLHTTVGLHDERFVAAGNYRFLLTDRPFWYAVANTAVFTVAHLLIQIPASLGLAMLLSGRRVAFRHFFRFAFFSTYLVGPVFVAVLFSMALGSRYGLFNQLLLRLFPGAAPVEWMSEPRLVLPAILIASLWLSIGFGMIYCLAALKAVDRQLYEAAAVDGAGWWSRFWHVTLPSIRPVLVFLVLVDTIAGFQLFELPYVLFQGSGPGQRGMTIVMYLVVWMQSGNLGYAAAIGWVLVVLILGAAIVQLRVTVAMQEARD